MHPAMQTPRRTTVDCPQSTKQVYHNFGTAPLRSDFKLRSGLVIVNPRLRREECGDEVHRRFAGEQCPVSGGRWGVPIDALSTARRGRSVHSPDLFVSQQGRLSYATSALEIYKPRLVQFAAQSLLVRRRVLLARRWVLPFRSSGVGQLLCRGALHPAPLVAVRAAV